MSSIVFKFKSINSSSSSVTGMEDSDESKIVIPSEDNNGIPITKISTNAFKGNKTIEEVIIPKTVKTIEDSAFEECSNLKKITLPKSMSSIGRHAFKRCDIRQLILPEITTLDFAAFSKNQNGVFVVKEKISYVKSHAFNECKLLVCTLSDRTTKKWDFDWNAGAKSFSDSDDDIPKLDKTDDESSDMKLENSGTLKEFVSDEAVIKQELLDQNIEMQQSTGIVYAKTVRFSFPVKRVLINKIPVLQSAQLSFYQKFIILLLEKGVKAEDSEELTNQLSNLLNVSRACVEDFVNYLIENAYLDYNNRTKKYSLCKEMHFTIKPEYHNAMFAELDTKLAECNRVIYLPELKMCFLEDDFNNGVFRRKGDSSKDNASLNNDEIDVVKSLKDEVRELLSRCFDKTNMHLKPEFSFDVSSNKSGGYSIEFDALLQYEYIKENKKSKLFNTIVLKDNFLPINYIDKLAKKYEYDPELPRFISLKEQFYDLVSSNTKEMDKDEESIENAVELVKPIEDDLSQTKTSLTELKKSNKQRKKEAAVAVDEVKERIKEKDSEIQINESLINKSSINDENLINNLKKTIKSLKKEKESLENELSSKIKDVDDLEKNLKKSEENLLKVIDEKEDILSKAKQVVSDHEKDLRDHGNILNALLSNNKNKTNPIIKSVVQKYPADKNIFYRYVTDIVVWLDSSLSASECNAIDETARCIDNIREMYRKVMQIVFDTLLNKNENTLGNYMSDPYNQIALDNLFKTRGVNSSVRQRLVMFHDVANAIGHFAENGPKKTLNIQKLTEFKKMSSNERSRIILSIPEFFDAISFNSKEINSFVKKLSIK